MSRYTIPALHPHHTCVVGYDPPLGTLFAQVSTPSQSGRPPQIVCWVGTDVQEILTVDALAAAIRAYATIPPAVWRQLATESQTVGFRPNFGTQLLHAMH